MDNRMRHSVKKGFSFGITSGIITTLGLMIGLHAGTHSRAVVIGGILTIAIADAFSDALGIHVSEEAEGMHTTREIWVSTVSTLLSKLVFAMTFVVPILFLSLSVAIGVSLIWGLLALCVFSFYIARKGGTNPWKATMEHLLIAVVVIALTHLIGDWIGGRFG